MSIFADVHTHTSFCDGRNTPEEMVLSAIEKGCQLLGFSGHADAAIPGAAEWCMSREKALLYAQEVERLKKQYGDRIKLLMGAEVDYFSYPLPFRPDYVIGSVHAVQVGTHIFDVDNTREVLTANLDRYYSGDAMAFVKDYYSLVSRIVDQTDCQIIGHFDLVTKFTEQYPLIDTSSKRYRHLALEALDALIEKHRIFEINTGAMARGLRTSPYPQDFLLRRLAEKNAAVILTSDAHHAKNIMYAFDTVEAYARSLGVANFVTPDA